jgi:hypothetical protein
MTLAPITMTELMAAERRGYLRGLKVAEDLAWAQASSVNPDTTIAFKLGWSGGCYSISDKLKALAKKPTT